MSELQEKMFFFEGSNQKRLLGFLHLPQKKHSSVGIVFCHPFAEEKNCSHAVIVKAARAFAEQGFPVLRFDLSGCGDSEGDLEEAIIDDWMRDIEKAVDQLKSTTNVTHIALWGLRFGAGLALLFAAEHEFVHFAILWHPVINFKEYIHQFLRQRVGKSLITAVVETDKVTVKTLFSRLRQGKSIEVIGYPITPKLYDSFLRIGNAPSRVPVCCPLFMTSVSMMDKIPFALTQFVDKLHRRVNRSQFSHVKAEPFWDRYWCWNSPALIQRTTDWLNTWK